VRLGRFIGGMLSTWLLSPVSRRNSFNLGFDDRSFTAQAEVSWVLLMLTFLAPRSRSKRASLHAKFSSPDVHSGVFSEAFQDDENSKTPSSLFGSNKLFSLPST